MTNTEHSRHTHDMASRVLDARHPSPRANDDTSRWQEGGPDDWESLHAGHCAHWHFLQS